MSGQVLAKDCNKLELYRQFYVWQSTCFISVGDGSGDDKHKILYASMLGH